MSTSILNRVTFRLFVGCLLTSEIRMHLKQSKEWQQSMIIPDHEERDLLEVHHLSKDYIGCYLSKEKATLSIVNEAAISIRKHLHAYCPGCDFNSIKIFVFPQVFIA